MKINKRIKAGLCALVATVLVAASGVVIACSDDDSGGGSSQPQSTTKVAEYSGDDTSAFSTVELTVQSGNVTGVTVYVGDTEYTAVATDDDDVWIVTVDGTMYTITVAGDATNGYTYTESVGIEYKATWGGTGDNALSGYTITVTASAETVIAVSMTDSSESDVTLTTVTAGSVYSFAVEDDGSATVYKITLSYDSTDDKYTYTYTSVDTSPLSAKGDLSGYTVTVYYNTEESKIESVAVSDSSSTPYTVTTNTGDTTTYSFTVTSDSDSDGTVDTTTVYTITPSVSSDGTASYSYTYVETVTTNYTATATSAITGTTIKVNATVVETYDGSSSTYEVESVNGVTAASSSDSSTTYTVTTNDDGTYSFTVTSADESSSTIYTVTLVEGTTDGVSFTYTYTSVVTLNLTATTSQDSIGTVVVVYNSTEGTIQAVTVDANEASEGETSGTYVYEVTSEDKSTTTTYTLEITITTSDGSTTASYTYTAAVSTNYEALGYTEIDISEITLSSSSVKQILTASDLSAAEEVVFVITYSTGTSSSDWFTICQNTSWSYQVAVGTQTADTYTLTLSSEGAYLESSDGTVSGYLKYDASGTWTCNTDSEGVDMISFFSSTGIYAALGSDTTLSAVYVLYGEDTGEDDNTDDTSTSDDSTTYSLIDVSDWDELLDETLSVSSSSGDINTSGTLTQVLEADDFADYKAIVIQGTATVAGYDTDGSTTLTSTASWLTAGGSSGSWTYGFIAWPTATTAGSTSVSITYQLYADETNVVKVWEGGYSIYESSSIDDFEKGIYLAGQYVEDIMVYGYGGTISFEEVEDNSESSGDTGEHADSVTLYDISVTLSSDFMMGFEGSCVSQLEEKGYSYCDADGEAGDPFEIAESYGANWARVRLWHTPLTKSDGNNTTDRAIEMGKDIKSAGMSFLLDFHYSDDWADPGAQAYPEAWDEITELGDSDDTEEDGTLCGVVYSYTLDVLTKLKEAGCTPDMVQLGNEINNGMLMTLSDGSTDATVQCSAGSSNMAAVLTAAANAVHAVSDDIKIMLHIASNRRYSTSTYTSWFTTLESAGFSDYDYIGLSYYPFYGHGTVGSLKDNIAALKAAGLGNNDSASVLVVETSWPWTNDNGDSTSNILDYSNAYMSAYMTEDSNNLSDSGSDLLDEIEFETYGSTSYIAFSAQNQVTIFEIIVEAVADAGGCGVFYWGSEWIPNTYTGSTWDNQALFDFDGICMPSMEMFSVGQ